MNPLRLVAGLSLVLALGAGSAVASESAAREHTKTGTYENVLEDLKNAIINRGYVIDYVGYFNKMLERTSDAVEGKSPYKNAHYMQFCAAKLTHAAISANPQAIANCPYVVYAYELASKPGEIHVGYRQPVSGSSEGERAAVEQISQLLNAITKEAAE